MNFIANRRAIMQVGAIAGSLALAGLATPFGHGALAQDATTPPALAAQTTPSAPAAPVAPVDPRVERYQAFIDDFAGHLGLSSDTVEQALRDTMKDMVDEGVAAGDLTADEAAAIKQQIDTAETLPMFGGHGPESDAHGGPGGPGGMEGRGKSGHGRGGHGGPEAGQWGGQQGGMKPQPQKPGAQPKWSDDGYEDDSDDENEYENENENEYEGENKGENEGAWAPQGGYEAPSTHSS